MINEDLRLRPREKKDQAVHVRGDGEHRPGITAGITTSPHNRHPKLESPDFSTALVCSTLFVLL